MVSVNLQNGEIKTVSAEKDTGSNYSKEIAENAAQYQGLSLDAEKRNREICDVTADNRDGKGMERIIKLL